MVTITLQGSSISEIRAQMRDFLGLDVETVGQTSEVYGKAPQMEGLAPLTQLNKETTETLAATEEKPKRKRRTKAEIEAAKSNGAARSTEDSFEVKKHHQEPSDEDESAENESPAIVQMNKQAPATTASAPIANKEAVHQALQQVNVAVGLPKAREILQAFGVNRISEIKEDQYKPFIEKCNEAVMMEG